MTVLNVEIKARCSFPDKIRSILEKEKADFKGTDHQIDTYFNVPEGRLKLREGSIENNLIYYLRSDTKKPKASNVNLVPIENIPGIKTLLTNALGILIVVDKKREIYFIDNIKFHIDEVKKLGSFIEIEAIDKTGTLDEEKLRDQCQTYLDRFEIGEKDLVAVSYSDLLLNK